jgi:SNF2 family DNA or RNA helicase
MPLHGFTAVDLGYQQGDAISNIVNRVDETAFTSTYLQLFDQIWSDPAKLEDVTSGICNHIESVYQENSPERIYFLMLYNIFSDFLDDIDEDVLPNDRTGYQDTLVWNKLFNFQHDAAIGIINKLETYNGCILADSVGLGKTFTALAVVKYYELRNRSVLVLCPKKLADNWLNYNSNLTTNIFAKDRFNYDVLCHTDLNRTSGESFGIPLNRINWGNYDLVVIDESHNFRNNDAVKDRETRYQKLMNQVVRQGVKTKVLMLSATPVNNRFNDLRNQLALAYEGDSENLSKKLRTGRTVEEIFRHAQATLASIRSDAERYIQVKLAGKILRDQIERYRQENQGPLVKRASEHFSALTLGSFESLMTDFNERDEPILAGIRPGGERVHVEGMSSGTRDQLYLALRLASLEKYMESSEPMPFIVDDVLVDFDDTRSQAALTALAELAEKTQVILFTHHSRVVEQSKKVNGVVNVQEL